MAIDDPLDGEAILKHDDFNLPSKSKLLELFPGIEAVANRIGTAERRRAVSRGFFWIATTLDSITPKAEVVGQIPLITYLVFDFPVAVSDIADEELAFVRDLLNRRARALAKHNIELEIDVLGTADTSGSAAVNKKLRQARATRVAEHIRSTNYTIRKVVPSDAPIAPDSKELGRSLNRSVTIHESANHVTSASVRRMPSEVENVRLRAREKLVEQASNGDVDADIGASLIDEYGELSTDLSIIFRSRVDQYYNKYVRETALRSDNPLYRADLFFLDARDVIRNTVEFAPSPATATDTELGSDDLVLTIKVLAEALYDGYNHHIQIGHAHNRGG